MKKIIKHRKIKQKNSGVVRGVSSYRTTGYSGGSTKNSNRMGFKNGHFNRPQPARRQQAAVAQKWKKCKTQNYPKNLFTKNSNTELAQKQEANYPKNVICQPEKSRLPGIRPNQPSTQGYSSEIKSSCRDTVIFELGKKPERILRNHR